MPLHKTKMFTVLAGAALAATLVVAPLVTVGATAAEPGALVGVEGDMQEATSEANNPSYWSDQYKAFDATCFNHTGNDVDNSHGSITDGGLTVTLKPFDQAWEGDAWVALIVKAGNTNNVVEFPKAGVAYASPRNNSGNQATVSHWIVCKGEAPVAPVAVTPTLTFTEPSCDAAGTVTTSENAVWTPKAGENGSTIWTATPKQGQVFTDGAKTAWTVPNLDKLSGEACLPPAPPAPEVKTTESSESDCASTSIVTTTVTTTTPYVREGEEWVLGEPGTQTTTKEREMTADEIADCPATATPTPTPVSTPTPTATPVPAALAATGGGVSPVVPLAGGAALLLGLAAVFFVAARRRQGV